MAAPCNGRGARSTCLLSILKLINNDINVVHVRSATRQCMSVTLTAAAAAASVTDEGEDEGERKANEDEKPTRTVLCQPSTSAYRLQLISSSLDLVTSQTHICSACDFIQA